MGVCLEIMVGLVELPVVESTGADCISHFYSIVMQYKSTIFDACVLHRLLEKDGYEVRQLGSNTKISKRVILHHKECLFF